MKKILTILGFAALFGSCAETPENAYKIDITAAGVADSTSIYIQKVNAGSQAEMLDTLMVIGEKAHYEGVAAKPGLHAMIVENIRGGFPFFIEAGDIDITIYKDSVAKSLVTGTPTNQDAVTFTENRSNLEKRFMSIQEQMREATNKRDTVSINVMRETYNELREDAQEMNYNFVKENPSSLFSAVLLANMLRSKSQPMDTIDVLFNAFDEEVKSSDFGVFINETLETVNKVKIGAKAPEFSAPTPEGKELALKDVLGKVTIIDFWAAWCQPCRKENPNMVKLYEAYHDKGLNMIGVSLDRTKEDWLKAIEEDGLPWYQISHLQAGNDPIARMYNVTSIPATFVLDENGMIIAKGLRGEALEAKIAELLP
ncbi:redoxin domain-containing protein [Robertkochia sediminum]|uniref:redoxin domain-containing protein n=1 Tax=Robertkochia sediminum TaxID=2785326 RepID=UPI0019316AD5|nr:redoxin domain-containing protein [Robertkochia sediminum]MBL7473499.1 redoxin domain-containing protein [Robertkochia sediminum]